MSQTREVGHRVRRAPTHPRRFRDQNFRRAHPPRQGRGPLGRAARLVVAPTGSGQDPGSRGLRAVDSWSAGRRQVRPERRCRVPLRLPTLQGRWPPTSSATSGRHWSASSRGPPGTDGARGHRGGPLRRHLSAAAAPAATKPPDILITTPESLFLMLTSAARSAWPGRDGHHRRGPCGRGTKRGHTSRSHERLDALLDRPAQRIGLSATVEPVDEVARPGRGTSGSAVRPRRRSAGTSRVVVPVEDLGALGEPTGDLSGPAAGEPRRTLDLAPCRGASSTSSPSTVSTPRLRQRRLAERLTARLNEADRLAAAAEATEGRLWRGPTPRY